MTMTSVKTLDKTVRLLSVFAAAQPQWSLTELSATLGMLISLVVLAAVLYGAVRLLESWILPWRPSEAQLHGG